VGGGFFGKLLTFLTLVLIYALAGYVWILPPSRPGSSTPYASSSPQASPAAQTPSPSSTTAPPPPAAATPPPTVAGMPNSVEPPTAPSAPPSPPTTPPAARAPSKEPPAARPPRLPPPSPSVPSADTSRVPVRYHVQVGAFKYREYAEELLQRLSSHGFTGTIVKDGIYRVWVGEYLERNEAERLADDLRTAGFETFLNSR